MAVGLFTFNVNVVCPHCDKDLYLNEYPYVDIGMGEAVRATSGKSTPEFPANEKALLPAIFNSNGSKVDLKYKC